MLDGTVRALGPRPRCHLQRPGGKGQVTTACQSGLIPQPLRKQPSTALVPRSERCCRGLMHPEQRLTMPPSGEMPLSDENQKVQSSCLMICDECASLVARLTRCAGCDCFVCCPDDAGFGSACHAALAKGTNEALLDHVSDAAGSPLATHLPAPITPSLRPRIKDREQAGNHIRC